MTNSDNLAKTKYEDAVASFRIEDEIARLQGDLGALNACIECCSRHCGANRVALRWVAASGYCEEVTFEQLEDVSARVANVVASNGIGAGDVVAGMLPRFPNWLPPF